MQELFTFLNSVNQLALGAKITVSKLFDSGKLDKDNEEEISALLDEIISLSSEKEIRKLENIDINNFIKKTQILFSGITTAADSIKSRAVALRRETGDKEFDNLRDQAIQIYRKIQLEFAHINEFDPDQNRRFLIEKELKRIHGSGSK